MKNISKFITVLIYVILCISSVNAEQLAPVDVLFHGSSHTDITQFNPRAEHVRDSKEGKMIFATPSIKLASCYLIRWDDSWIFQFITSDNQNRNNSEITMVISDRERFNKLDKGGVIYLLPADNFSYDKEKGLGIYEWVSRESVSPVAKLYFVSALQAMKNFGVKIYFVDKKQFRKLLSLSGEKWNNYLKKITQQSTHLLN